MSDIPQWAKEAAAKRSGWFDFQTLKRTHRGPGSVTVRAVEAFASYIAQHEDEPVDPLGAEADRLASGHRVWADEEEYDAAIALALVALRRGIELAKAGDA